MNNNNNTKIVKLENKFITLSQKIIDGHINIHSKPIELWIRSSIQMARLMFSDEWVSEKRREGIERDERKKKRFLDKIIGYSKLLENCLERKVLWKKEAKRFSFARIYPTDRTMMFFLRPINPSVNIFIRSRWGWPGGRERKNPYYIHSHPVQPWAGGKVRAKGMGFIILTLVAG